MVQRIFLLLLALALIGCGGGTGSGLVTVSVSPTTATILPNAQVQIQATVTGSSDTAVDWSAPDGGSVVDGLFTAPASTGDYRVIATSLFSPDQSATATIHVKTTGVVITPSSLTVTKGSVNNNAFTATVTGNANRAVVWSIEQGSVGGTITNGTVDGSGNARANYTAGTTSGVFTIRATSVADPTSFATAQVTVVAGSSLTISPTSATVGAGETVVLTALLTKADGTPDTTSTLEWDFSSNPIGATLTGSDLRQRTFTAPAGFTGTATCQVRVRRSTGTGVAALSTITVDEP